MGNTTRQGMKFGLILLLLLAGVVLGIRMLLSREGGRPRYTDMPQLLALCGSKNAPAVKEALLHSDEGALRNEETTLLHVLLERDADPAVLREALSPPSSLLRMVQLTDAQGRTPLHIAAARANPAALLLLHCMGARDTTPDREGRLALDIIQELGADEMAARLPFWENRGKQEGRMVVNLQQSKTVQIRGRKYRLEAKGFLSYASLATNEGELAYVAAVQGAAASLPEDERYNIQNNDTDLPYIPDHIGCEQSRKLRISVTRIENGPDPFFKYGMVFALINLFERRAREKRRGACQNRHKPRLFFYACSFAASTAVSLVRLIS